MTLSLDQVAQALGGEVSGGQVSAPGPGHSSSDRSLSIKLDDAAPEGFIVNSFAKDDPIACRDYVRQKLGLPEFKPKKASGNGEFIREHIYQTADGVPHLRKRKYLKPDGGKEFPQANWSGGQWVKGAPKAKILYRLPELLKAPPTSPIFVTEGEGDCDALAALSFVSTTAGGVSSEWTAELAEPLKGRHVIIVVDSDAPGRKYGEKVARVLDPIAELLKVVDLFPEDIAEKNGRDVSDFLKRDTAGVNFIKAANDAPLWEPRPETAGGDKSASGDADDKPKGAKQADVLIALSERAEELFHAPDATAFATIPVDDHLETWPVRSKGFRRWLAREFFTKAKSAANSDAMQSALNVIEARAHFDGVEREVYVRVGACNGRLYLDLADRRWRAVEISADGWRIIDRAPIPFRRSAGMRPLPDPIPGGSINELRPFLNISGGKDDSGGSDSFVLAVCFALAALRERGPYPVLCLAGEHGAAKSTFTAVLRRLIDPNSAPLRALPREDRDLFIAANNAHLLAFDNVSHLPDWISDTLCRLATGGGFATRQLYSDQDEALFDAMRPVILNGIEDVVIRPDLADRSIFLNLQNIADDKRKAEKEFWSEFEAAHPRILGALLDGAAVGLRQLPTTQLAKMPRMADFARWSAACETAYWEAGTFAKAYGQNRDDAVGAVIEADTIATAVQNFMAERPDLKQQKQSSLIPVDRTQWTGTAADLLGALKMAVGEEKAKHKEWPSTPRALSSRLRRAAGTLRKVGNEITFDRDPGGKRRTITIKEKEAQFASQPSPPSQFKDVNGLDRDASCDAKNDAVACVTPRPSQLTH